jgi:hypothetical protein
MIPAADLNAHAASLRRLSDEEVDTLTLARWERWQRSFPERSQDAEGQG